MKNKILLEVCLPMAEQSFDIRIPRQLRVDQATGMLVAFLRKQEDVYIPTEESMLCDMENGRVFDPNVSIGMSGLQNGSRVMLI